MSFTASNTVIIGDTLRDVEAGRMGGAQVIAVASGRSRRVSYQVLVLISFCTICGTPMVLLDVYSRRRKSMFGTPSSLSPYDLSRRLRIALLDPHRICIPDMTENYIRQKEWLTTQQPRVPSTQLAGLV
jgi:HAD-hyrolase-like